MARVNNMLLKKASQWLSMAAILSCVNACVTARTGGSFDKTAFTHDLYSYQVRYLKESRLLPDDWFLYNFQEGHDGKPGKPKEGGDYQTNLWLDLNGDGKYEKTEDYPIYDLLFRHRRHDGKIWIRSLPLSQKDDQVDLSVLMHRFIDAMSGAGFSTTRIEEGEIEGVERRFATKILDEGEGLVYGQKAHAVLLEIANVDQLKLSPESRWKRSEIILIKSDYFWMSGIGHDTRMFPVLMIAGYSNIPKDFDSGYGDFREFMTRLELRPYPKIEEPTASAVFACAPQPDRIRLYLEGGVFLAGISSLDLSEPEKACVFKALESNAIDPASAYRIVRRRSVADDTKTALPTLLAREEQEANVRIPRETETPPTEQNVPESVIYRGKLAAFLYRDWKTPQPRFEGEFVGLVTQVEVFIDQTGQLTSYTLIQKSDNELFDASVGEHLQKLIDANTVVPEPSADAAGDFLGKSIELRFVYR